MHFWLFVTILIIMTPTMCVLNKALQTPSYISPRNQKFVGGINTSSMSVLNVCLILNVVDMLYINYLQ